MTKPTEIHSSTSDKTELASRGRRQVLAGTVAGAVTLAAPAIVRAQSSPKIRIGFWPVASGIPFYA
ncbi:MAG: hypothetical protein ACK44V_10865, partial [Burkholderiales bacterium]